MKSENIELALAILLEHTRTGRIHWKLCLHTNGDKATACYSTQVGEGGLMICPASDGVAMTMLDGLGRGSCTFPSTPVTNLLLEAVEESAVDSFLKEFVEDMPFWSQRFRS